MKKTVLTLFLAVLVCICSGCGLNGYPVNVFGKDFKEAPKRVVCFSDTAAGYISSLGYGEFIVGVPGNVVNDFEGAADIGTPTEIYNETVISLKPDLIITSFEIEKDFAELLNQNKINVLNTENLNKFEDIKKYLFEISKLFCGEKKAEKKLNEYYDIFNGKISEIKSNNTASGKKALIFIDDGFVITGDTFAGDVLKTAGINNTADNEQKYLMTEENIIKANPDVIFCPKGFGDKIMKKTAFKELSAVKSGYVYEISVDGIFKGCEKMLNTLNEITNYLV